MDVLILMLGTNDFQAAHDNNAALSAQGTARLIDIIRQAPIEPGMPIPQIMVVCPPQIVAPSGEIAGKFAGAQIRCVGLPAELGRVAAEHSALFFDAGTVTQASLVDGIHLDENQHRLLGEAIAQAVRAAIQRKGA